MAAMVLANPPDAAGTLPEMRRRRSLRKPVLRKLALMKLAGAHHEHSPGDRLAKRLAKPAKTETASERSQRAG
jgi:hypothetical protein